MTSTQPLTRKTPVTLSVDDLNGQTVAATAKISSYYGQAIIVLDTDADAHYGKKPGDLTPAAARALAAHLIELADLADAYDGSGTYPADPYGD